MQDRRHVAVFVLIPALIVFYFVFNIFRPFLVSIAMALVLATLTSPVFDFLKGRLGNRNALAALCTCILITFVILVPITLLIGMLVSEVTAFYDRLSEQVESGGLEQLWTLSDGSILRPLRDWLAQFVDFEKLDLAGSLAAGVQRLSMVFLRSGGTVLGGVLSLVTHFFVMLVTLFFLFRDRDTFERQIRSLTPLSADHEDRIATTFRNVSRAIILGSLGTAAAQGLVGGLVFLVLGLPNSLFWGTLMGLFSLVPLVGPAIIWAPWALYLLFTGETSTGILLILLSIVLVGSVDNIVRPLLVGERSGMPILFVFLSIAGGIAYFGMVGMIFGPILVALGLTFIELYKTEFSELLKKGKPEAQAE